MNAAKLEQVAEAGLTQVRLVVCVYIQVFLCSGFCFNKRAPTILRFGCSFSLFFGISYLR